MAKNARRFFAERKSNHADLHAIADGNAGHPVD